ncbi:MAG TPA: glutamate formimidoyltransferase [Nitrospiraceae bacterium]|nr:glutamate formimidoyltransferase [Nitrospiraceae bacterium]
MERIVECVPNFSEGRNAATVHALVNAIRAVKWVFVLDEEMDQDHHRSVLTFVGRPEAVAEAAFQATSTAAGLIDLRVHQGGHPRVGATDVVPFVPIKGVTMEDCIALARRVGKRIGNELGIPVFLYERATEHPDRANLETIRRGGLEGLASRMASEPDWVPDFGPRHLHPTAGATVVGARPPLIAYNVNLQTDDLAVAKAIAKTVRFSSGGLPYLKAIGVELKSRRLVQVSMNLTNFEETPIHVAFDAVKREAEQRGVEVCGSELIGLVPQRALIQGAEFFLKLERFDPTQVLENRLELVLAREAKARGDQTADLASSVSGFLSAVAAGTPTPGGGSVAALAGALAAALGVMACRIGPPADQKQQSAQVKVPGATSDLEATERRLRELSEKLRGLVEADADAYAGVVTAYRLPKTDPSRPSAIATSLRIASEVPLETATLASEAASLLRTLLAQTKPTVAPDLKVGLLMARAAIEGGLENVYANLRSQANQSVVNDLTQRARAVEQRLVELKSL